VAAGQNDLTLAAVVDYELGVFNAAHPLTLFCYSQGAVVCNNDEPTLIKDGIPSNAIHIVEVGDTSSSQTGWDGATGPIDGYLDNTAAPGTLTALGLNALGWGNLVGDTTPTDDYDTYVYTIYGDQWADVSAPVCELCHDAYLGLTPGEISSAVPVIDGLTTYFDIPALSTTALDNALFGHRQT
jgi:PE-PPE domain